MFRLGPEILMLCPRAIPAICTRCIQFHADELTESEEFDFADVFYASLAATSEKNAIGDLKARSVGVSGKCC